MIERIQFSGKYYWLNPEEPTYYAYDEDNFLHIIVFAVRDYSGNKHLLEWRIPGTDNKDITYAKRLALKWPAYAIKETFA